MDGDEVIQYQRVEISNMYFPLKCIGKLKSHEKKLSDLQYPPQKLISSFQYRFIHPNNRKISEIERNHQYNSFLDFPRRNQFT